MTTGGAYNEDKVGMSRLERGSLPIARRDRAAKRRQSEESGIFPSLPPGRPLSRTLWGLDFSQTYPLELSKDGVTAVSGDFLRARAFLADEFPSLTQEGLGRESSPSISRAKAKYVRGLSDLVELRHLDQTVGVLIGAPEDWATYYVRTFAVLPSHQRPGLLRRFIREGLFAPLLSCGVERVVAETSPANLTMTRLLAELRFYPTGHRLTDRWGALVRYTKFLDESCQAQFIGAFAGTAPSRRK